MAMSENLVEYRSGAIRPLECFKSGWNSIRGQYWLFLGITLIGIILGSVVPLAIIMGPMMCGIYLCLLTRMRGGEVKFDMLFRGFDYFAPSLIVTLIQTLPLLVITVPLNFIFTFRLMT